MKPKNLKVASVMAGFVLLNIATSALAANTVVLPEYSKPVLTPLSQTAPLVAWTNVVPNALADYFTYVPYSNASAVAMGFPATCGNTALVASPLDVASTEDCYTISVREFNQQMALPTIFGGGAGLLKRDGATPFGAATRAWGYGSGGVNWPKLGVTGNAPAGPLATGVWHAPAPTLRGAKGRPIRIQWVNELAGTVAPPTGFDPTIDCGMGAPNCYPYNRIVTHVHGAHVTPESDGFADSWYTNNATDPFFQTPGSLPTLVAPSYNGPPMGYGMPWIKPAGPATTYRYPMDQEAGTIWYHDHAMGSTHLNTQMGMAGFFPITDNNEKYLQGQIIVPVAGELNPTPGVAGPKYLPTGPYELGFALQDRMFTTDGQFAMPDYPVYDLNTGLPGGSPAIAFTPLGAPIPCALLANGLADPSTCKRLDWMKAADGHLIPYVEGDPLLANPINELAPFPAGNATLEYFGNMPMVNGVTYGKYDVEPQIYRMRFIGGTDSRTWILQLKQRVGGAIIPFYQIGTEQGFVNAPIQRTSMLLMPGERLDVLVDFRGLPLGTKVVLANIGPDGPYQGEANPIPSVDIPEVMEFNVAAANAIYGVVPAAQATGIPALPGGTIPATITNLRPVSGAITTLPLNVPAIPARNVSLMEITDNLGRTTPTIDSRGFMGKLNGIDIPITEVISLMDTEEWDIINTTMDAHPMHLHQVAFQVISRTPFDNVSVSGPTAFVPPVTDTLTGVYREPKYTVTGPAVPPDAWDAGWKDTVYSPPGFVTKVRAKFDLSGLYVWHCHILSHEEHDMMRAMLVVSPMTSVALAAPPASFPRLATGAPVTFTATPTGATGMVEYRFSYKLDAAPTYTLGRDYSTTATWNWNTAALPAGSYTVQVEARNLGARRTSEAINTLAALVLTNPTNPTAMITPVTASTLTTADPTFTWTNGGASLYQIWVGTTAGTFDLGYSPQTAALSATVTGLPTDGRTVHVRLWSQVGAAWYFNDYTYTAAGGMTAPLNNTVLASANQTFTWNGFGASTYQVWVGTTPGAFDLGYSAQTASTTATVNGLPTDGRPLKVRVWGLVGANWVFSDYTYTAAGGMIAPLNNAVLAGATQTFSWHSTGANLYQIWVGTTVGAFDLGYSPQVVGTTTTVSGFPATVVPTPVKVRLWSRFGTDWTFSDYTYTSGP